MKPFHQAALGGEGSGKEASFQAREATHAPLGVGDLADQFGFQRVGRLDVGFEGRELTVEVGRVLTGQDGIAGEESVFEGVGRATRFAFLGAWTGGFLGARGDRHRGTTCPTSNKSPCVAKAWRARRFPPLPVPCERQPVW